MPKQNNTKANRKGSRTQKRKHTRPVLTGGSGVTWLEFLSGKRSTQRRSRKRANSNRH